MYEEQDSSHDTNPKSITLFLWKMNIACSQNKFKTQLLSCKSLE